MEIYLITLREDNSVCYDFYCYADDITHAIEQAENAYPEDEVTSAILQGNETKKEEKRFEQTWCSQCGEDFGPGDHGFSHCDSHEGKEEI